MEPDRTDDELRGTPDLITPVQAFLDLASAGIGLVDLVIAGDSLVKANDLDPMQFIAAANAYQGRNAKRARRAASLVRRGVDSPMETRIRLLIVFAGLPEPQVNFILRFAGGTWRWRFDLCYPEYKLIIEYNGRQHAFDADQWIHDLERREWLDQDGWRIVVVVSEDIYGRPLRTLQRVRTALMDRGARVSKSFSQEWTRHFVVRAWIVRRRMTIAGICGFDLKMTRPPTRFWSTQPRVGIKTEARALVRGLVRRDNARRPGVAPHEAGQPSIFTARWPIARGDRSWFVRSNAGRRRRIRRHAWPCAEKRGSPASSKGMTDLGVTCRPVTDTFGLHGKPEHLVLSACDKDNPERLAITKRAGAV